MIRVQRAPVVIQVTMGKLVSQVKLVLMDHLDPQEQWVRGEMMESQGNEEKLAKMVYRCVYVFN